MSRTGKHRRPSKAVRVAHPKAVAAATLISLVVAGSGTAYAGVKPAPVSGDKQPSTSKRPRMEIHSNVGPEFENDILPVDLYRGDSRSPDIIFESGFTSNAMRNPDQEPGYNLAAHQQGGPYGERSGFISTSSEASVARQFALPSIHGLALAAKQSRLTADQMASVEELPSPGGDVKRFRIKGWVYHMDALRNAIDVNRHLGNSGQGFSTQYEYAVVARVPSNSIKSAQEYYVDVDVRTQNGADHVEFSDGSRITQDSMESHIQQGSEKTSTKFQATGRAPYNPSAEAEARWPAPDVLAPLDESGSSSEEEETSDEENEREGKPCPTTTRRKRSVDPCVVPEEENREKPGEEPGERPGGAGRETTGETGGGVAGEVGGPRESLESKQVEQAFEQLVRKYGLKVFSPSGIQLTATQINARIRGYSALSPEVKTSLRAGFKKAAAGANGAIMVAGAVLWAKGVHDVFVNDTTALDKAVAITSIIPFVGCGTATGASVAAGQFDAGSTALCFTSDVLMLTPAWPAAVALQGTNYFIEQWRQAQVPGERLFRESRNTAWDKALAEFTKTGLESSVRAAVSAQRQQFEGQKALIMHNWAEKIADMERGSVSDSTKRLLRMSFESKMRIEIDNMSVALKEQYAKALTDSLEQRGKTYNEEFIAREVSGGRWKEIPLQARVAGPNETAEERKEHLDAIARLLRDTPPPVSADIKNTVNRMFDEINREPAT